MKKILLGTSAVALAGASATSANAAEWDLSWGGYMNTYLNFLSLDDDNRDGFDVLQDGEIIFSPSITLDNGLTFGVNVQFEADSFDGGDDVDEAYVTVGGSFGQVVLGSDDSAFGTMLYGAAGVGWAGVRSATMTGTMMGGGFGARGDHVQLAGDAMRVTYYSPRFAGFQIGASYARTNDEDDRSHNPDNVGLQDILSLGANYNQTFGNVAVRLSGIFETGSNEPGGGDPTNYSVGGQVGFGGVTIGGAYAKIDPDTGGNDETDFFNAGVSYTTGPWGVSVSGAFTDAPGYDTTQAALNGTYDLGPGVTAGAYLGYAERENDGGADIDGFVIGTGLALSF